MEYLKAIFDGRVFEEEVYNETLLYYQNNEMVKQINEHCKAHF